MLSSVRYNGLNFPFRRMIKSDWIPSLAEAGLAVSDAGFLLHVGGNQWYKNRLGVLEIYAAYAALESNPLQLWMVGAPPTAAMQAMALSLPDGGQVRFLSGLTDEQVCAAYSAAKLMIFPSLCEGFGWPIAEAMACGCPVLTTDEAPMTEVGGEAAFYIPRRPDTESFDWSVQAGKLIAQILSTPLDAKQHRQNQGFQQCAQFDTHDTLNAYEKIYQDIVDRVGSKN